MATEIRKLKERNSAVSADLDALQRLSEDQLAEIGRLGEAAETAESRWRAEIEKLTTESELKRYQSVEAERNKWEAREDRLVTELTTVKAELNSNYVRGRNRKRATTVVQQWLLQRRALYYSHHCSILLCRQCKLYNHSYNSCKCIASSATTVSSTTTAGSSSTGVSATTAPSTGSSSITTTASIEGGTIMTSSTSTVTSATVSESKTPTETLPLLATQQPPPPLTKFPGDDADSDGETFLDWLE